MIWTKIQVLDYISKLKDDDIIEVTKKQTKTIRSTLQNNYYWGIVVDIISNHHWMTAIETHLAIKKTFWVETTTDLSTSEFKYLMELIQELWKTKFWVVIPSPSSVEELKNLDAYLF
jgi:hypothetical protein